MTRRNQSWTCMSSHARLVMTVMMPSPNKWCGSLRARHSVFCGPCPDPFHFHSCFLLLVLFSGATGSRIPHYACRGMNAKILRESETSLVGNVLCKQRRSTLGMVIFSKLTQKESEMTIIAMMQASMFVPYPSESASRVEDHFQQRCRDIGPRKTIIVPVCGLTYLQPQSFLDGNREEPWVRVRPSASAGRTQSEIVLIKN